MSELSDRAVGSVGAVGGFGLFIIWISDVPDLYKHLATGFAVLIACLIIGINALRTRRLHQKRLEQMRLHHVESRDLNQTPRR